jgi:thiamine biosynthesis lipoprotein
MRRRAFIMGMPVVLDIPGASDPGVFKQVFHELHLIDSQFSPFIERSELSRFRRGEIAPDKLSIGMKAVMKACLEAEAMTDGYFSARYSEVFDPTGYVKGWAIAEASRKLLKRGIGTFSLSVGGDINAYSNSDKIWRIGILDPFNKGSIVGKIVGQNLAIATSGNYERGNHIINPKTGKPARELLSLTVEGPDIIKADILATAAYAMGKQGLKFIDEKMPGYEVLAIDRHGEALLSGGMRTILVLN